MGQGQVSGMQWLTLGATSIRYSAVQRALRVINQSNVLVCVSVIRGRTRINKEPVSVDFHKKLFFHKLSS